jgi:protein-disulfide isomerase
MMNKKVKKNFFNLLIVFFIIVSSGVILVSANSGRRTSSLPSLNEYSIDVCFGKKDAPLTIIEYSSLNCPHCANFHNSVFPKLKEKYIDTGQVKLIFRHFPIDHQAFTAALVSASLPAERKLNFITEVFHNQSKYFSKDSDTQLSELAGIDTKSFKACIANHELQDQILNQRLTAEKDYKVDGAPTFFLDGKKYSGTLPLEEVEKSLNKKNISTIG